MKLPLLALALLLAACSPYAKPLSALDADYKSGRINTAQYYAIKAELMRGDTRWQANFDARMQNGFAGMNQRLYQQQQLNAYDARTRALAAPRYDTLNVLHY